MNAPHDPQAAADDASPAEESLDAGLAAGFAAAPDATKSFRPPAEAVGAMVAGKYKLLEEIGEGGMGTVWMAEQTQPVKRKVALKLIKAGMDSKSVLARFEAERQALALMDHANIAKVLDGGLTEGGRPYFVMEYVKGIPITEYCDSVRLSIGERLNLFVQVCSAVQHAHQKGIIHRDLKPSNILVAPYDDRPVPKVIDFGLAKAMHQSLTDRTLHTAHETVLGTPLYMSPEQAQLNNLDVDTRADVYSLGVLLYELLTGTTPLERKRFKEAAWEEMRRIIREEEPPRPSARLSSADTLPSLAACRQSDPRKLTQQLRGELDWIVMKALEKDRTRRYDTANGLARDVQRFLADEIVEARPPSAGYRLRKFVRRHKGQVIAAGLVVSVLLAGIVGTTFGLVQANEQREKAEIARGNEEQAKLAAEKLADAEKEARQQAQRDRDAKEEQRRYAQAIADFVRDDFLALTSIEGQERFGGLRGESLSRETTLLELLDRAADKLDQRKDLDPLTEAELRWMIGVNYRGVGNFDRAVTFLEKAFAIRQRVLGQDDPLTLEAGLSLGVAYHDAGKLQDAIQIHRQMHDAHVRKGGADHHGALRAVYELAQAYRAIGDLAQATQILEHLRDVQPKLLGANHADTLTTLVFLAAIYKDTGRAKKAIAILEQVRDTRMNMLGPQRRETLNTQFTLAQAYLVAGEQTKAIQLSEQVRDLVLKKLEVDHPDTLAAHIEVAHMYRSAGKPMQAIEILEGLHHAQLKKFGPDHSRTISTLDGLAAAYLSAGRLPRAIEVFEQVRDFRLKKYGPEHPNTLHTLGGLARAYIAAGMVPQAIELLEQIRDTFTRKFGANYPDTLKTNNNLAMAYGDAGRLDEAIELFERIREPMVKKVGTEHRDTLAMLNNLASAYQRSPGKLPQAIELFEQVRDILVRKLGADHPDTLTTFNNLAGAYKAIGKLDAAIKVFEKARDGSVKTLGPDHPLTLGLLANLANAYRVAGNVPQAIEIFEQIREPMVKKIGRDHPHTLKMLSNLAFAYYFAGRFQLAIDTFERVHEAQVKKLGEHHPETVNALGNLGGAYAKAMQGEKAAATLSAFVAGMRKQFPTDHPQLAVLLAHVSLDLCQCGQHAAAEPMLRECLAIREKVEPEVWTTFNTQSMLGGALLGQKKYADAEPLLVKGYEGMKAREKAIPPPAITRIPEALDLLIELYAATNRPDEAKKWEAERAKYARRSPPPKEKK
jgi:serine/threonine protein kinase/tetratricopeptide (TPR) repeat protein